MTEDISVFIVIYTSPSQTYKAKFPSLVAAPMIKKNRNSHLLAATRLMQTALLQRWDSSAKTSIEHSDVLRNLLKGLCHLRECYIAGRCYYFMISEGTASGPPLILRVKVIQGWFNAVSSSKSLHSRVAGSAAVQGTITGHIISNGATLQVPTQTVAGYHSAEVKQ